MAPLSPRRKGNTEPALPLTCLRVHKKAPRTGRSTFYYGGNGSACGCRRKTVCRPRIWDRRGDPPFHKIGTAKRTGLLTCPVLLVEMVGLEPMTSCMSSMRSNQLSYTSARLITIPFSNRFVNKKCAVSEFFAHKLPRRRQAAASPAEGGRRNGSMDGRSDLALVGKEHAAGAVGGACGKQHAVRIFVAELVRL